MLLPAVVEDVGVLEVVARQRADAMRAEELGLVQHAREDAAQLLLVHDRQHAAVGHAGLPGQVHVGGELGVAADELPGAFPELRQLREDVLFEDRHRRQRQQPHDRAHLEPRRGAVREPQHVVEEAVLLVPHLVVTLADPVHGAGDGQRVLEELLDELLVQRLVQRELDRDAQHLLAEEHHPRRAVGLVEVAAGGQRRGAVEHADVVEPEEAAFEHVGAGAILAVDPPGEVHQQLGEGVLEELDVAAAAAALLVDQVELHRGPRVHRRIDVAEVPLVGGQLAVRVQVVVAQHQIELLLGEVGIDHAQRNHVERQVPRRVPRVFPLVRHRDDVVVEHVRPLAVAHAPALVLRQVRARHRARRARGRGRSRSTAWSTAFPPAPGA